MLECLHNGRLCDDLLTQGRFSLNSVKKSWRNISCWFDAKEVFWNQCMQIQHYIVRWFKWILWLHLWLIECLIISLKELGNSYDFCLLLMNHAVWYHTHQKFHSSMSVSVMIIKTEGPLRAIEEACMVYTSHTTRSGFYSLGQTRGLLSVLGDTVYKLTSITIYLLFYGCYHHTPCICISMIVFKIQWNF